MRDLAVLIALFLIVPLVLRNAFAAFIVWGWTVAISLNYYLYGFLNSFRFNLLFAVLTLSLLLLGRIKTKLPWKFTPTTFLLVWFCVHVSLSAIFGYGNNRLNSEYWGFFAKSMTYCLLIPILLSTRLRIHAFLVMYGMGLAFHGLLDGLKLIASGGGHRSAGLPGSMMSDNNHFAVALSMALPILYYLYQYSKNHLTRNGFLAAFILTIIALISTRSRGGMVALVIIGLFLIVTSRRKFLSLTLVAASAFMVINLAPPEWFERMATVENAGEDASFMGRVIAWKVSSAIALDNPLFGGGFHAVQSQAVWDKFKFSPGMLGFINTPTAREAPQAAHSVYFEVLGDHGIVGLLLFLGILVTSFASCLKIRKLTRNRPDLVWARDLSDLLGIAVLAYAVGGAAVNLGYFELYYMLVMVIVALRQHVERSISSHDNRS